MKREPMNHLTIHKHPELSHLRAHNPADIYVLIKHLLYNCKEFSTNHLILCKTNPISEKPKMNVTSVNTMNYELRTMNYFMQNKPNSNPIKANTKPIKANKMPKQTQTNPNKARLFGRFL
jgi:hypothetical protein